MKSAVHRKPEPERTTAGRLQAGIVPKSASPRWPRRRSPPRSTARQQQRPQPRQAGRSAGAAISAAINSSQDDAPKAMATAGKPGVRPKALRAREMSAASQDPHGLGGVGRRLSAGAAFQAQFRARRPRGRARQRLPAGWFLRLRRVPSAREPAYFAARELGDDPAGGEATPNAASGRSRDQFGGAVDQVAAFLHQHVDLLAGGAAQVLAGADASQRAIGQFSSSAPCPASSSPAARQHLFNASPRPRRPA